LLLENFTALEENIKKVAFISLGCKLNFAETSTIAQSFEKKGFIRVKANEQADIYVINTCTVTQLADKKSRQAIKKIINNAPAAKVIAVGCYAQLKSSELSSIRGVDLVLGNDEKFRLVEYIELLLKESSPKIDISDIKKNNDFNSAFSIGDRTRSFLKIQDGCDFYCSYCTVPLARGHSRNKPIKEIIDDCNNIASYGVKEVVLTGVNIGDFGKSTGEDFLSLLIRLEKNTDIERFRISSIEPNLLNNEIIEFINNSKKFARHFHISLQSGCDKILALMNRKYKRDLFANHVETIKKINNMVSIGADIIVGFPGETADDFFDTYNFIKDLDLSYLHVFKYSERPNTKAILLPNKVKPQEKEERSKVLLELSEEKKHNFYKKNIGKTEKILFENKNKNNIVGFSGNYIKCETAYKQDQINKIINCRFLGINNNGNMNVVPIIE
jgi:threonylcarbamoyladenosine tRNA methylthiotransferase MtaB